MSSPPFKQGDLVAGRYRILGVLGRGGMGTVYEADQLALDRKVALKVLSPDRGGSIGRARFEREARVAAALRHPGAVEIYDFGEDDGQLYIAMARLEGTTLRGLLRGGEPALSQTVGLGAEIAEVLAAAHRIELVHRDLKPENIFLERGSEGEPDRVVVVDFGLAFRSGDEKTGRLTREGVMAGTPAYLSPEQALGSEVTGATDLYALGCVLYELVTGAPPFTDESELQVLMQHVYAAPVPPSDVRQDRGVPRALEDLILKALSKQPAERPTAEEALEALRRLFREPPGRDRGRDESHLLDREARMIPEPRPTLDTPTITDRPGIGGGLRTGIEIVGVLDESLRSSLVVNGLQPLDSEDLGKGAGAIYAPGAGGELLEELRSRGLPLVTDADPSDMARVSELLRVGVDEVVPVPVRGDELARKVWRAIRKHRRGSRRG